MAEPIEFWFDFSSPYGYLAAKKIDAIAEQHGRRVAWKPTLLGVIFQTTGQVPLAGIPLKGDYLRHDLPRSARRLGVPLKVPARFPFVSVAAARAVCWLTSIDPEQGAALARALYHAAFGEGRDIGGVDNVLAVARAEGLTGADTKGAALAEALPDPAVKGLLRRQVEESIAKGVFGSPYVIVEGEPFWGHDRLDEVDAWLESGGW